MTVRKSTSSIKTPKTRNIEDYYITDCVYKEKPLINYNWWYRDWGFKAFEDPLDTDVWVSFIKDPVNPTNTEPTPVIDTSNMTKEEISELARKRRTALVDELAEMWLWNDLERRKDYSFYELLPIVPPVQVPPWILSLDKSPDENIRSLTHIDKIALCIILQFTQSHSTGYIECSGNIEKACNCTVNEAHHAIARLFAFGLLLEPEFPPLDTIHNMYRCASWKVNPLLLKLHLESQGFNFGNK